jgi:hypothetical protein
LRLTKAMRIRCNVRIPLSRWPHSFFFRFPVDVWSCGPRHYFHDTWEQVRGQRNNCTAKVRVFAWQSHPSPLALSKLAMSCPLPASFNSVSILSACSFTLRFVAAERLTQRNQKFTEIGLLYIFEFHRSSYFPVLIFIPARSDFPQALKRT